MHVVVQDSLTLIAIAIVYTLAALQLRPFFGVYLTKHVILGVPLFGALVRYRLHYVLKSEEPARAQDVERGGKVQDVARSDEQGRRGITYPAMLRRVSKIEVSDLYFYRQHTVDTQRAGLGGTLQGTG